MITFIVTIILLFTIAMAGLFIAMDCKLSSKRRTVPMLHSGKIYDTTESYIELDVSRVPKSYVTHDGKKVPTKSLRIGCISGNDLSAFGLDAKMLVLYKDIHVGRYGYDIEMKIGDFVIIEPAVVKSANPFSRNVAHFHGLFIRKLITVFDKDIHAENEIPVALRKIADDIVDNLKHDMFLCMNEMDIRDEIMSEFKAAEKAFPSESMLAVVYYRARLDYGHFNVVPVGSIIGLLEHVVK